MIQTHAPNRLAKLEFKRIEYELRHELKRAEDELNDEQSALEADVNPDVLFERHEKVFRGGELVSRFEALLSDLRSCSSELAELDSTTAIETTCSSLEQWVGSIRTAAAEMAARLQMLPKTWAFVESTLGQIDSWLSEISRRSLGLFDSHLNSAFEYKRCIERLIVSFKKFI